MTNNRIAFSLCALLVSVAVCVQLALGERKIVVTEQLGLTWSDEVLTYPFSAEKGRCVVSLDSLLV